MGGAGRFVVGVLAAGLALLLGSGLVLQSYYADDAAADDEAPTPLFARADDCDAPCSTTSATDAFVVGPHVREIDFTVYALLDPSSGPAYVTVTDPTGEIRYERLFTADVKALAQDAVTWVAVPGEWTLTRSYLGVVGVLEFQAWGDTA